MLQPPRRPPDHVTTTVGTSIPLTMEQSGSFTCTWTQHCANLYAALMLGVYRLVEACDQSIFHGYRMPLPSNFSFHEWDAIAHSETDRETIQFWRYGFPMRLKVPSLHLLLAIMLQPCFTTEMWALTPRKKLLREQC